MWVIVMFDAPVTTATARREHTSFRELLVSCGMVQVQFSVYARFFPSGKSCKRMLRAVQMAAPRDGRVMALIVSDREYSSAFRFIGRNYLENHGDMPETPSELTIF